MEESVSLACPAEARSMTQDSPPTRLRRYGGAAFAAAGVRSLACPAEARSHVTRAKAGVATGTRSRLYHEGRFAAAGCVSFWIKLAVVSRP